MKYSGVTAAMAASIVLSACGGPASPTPEPPMPVRPTARYLYALERTSSATPGTIGVYRVDADGAALTRVPTVGPELDPVPDAIVVHPNASFVYASSWSRQRIYAFAVEPTTGALTPVPGSPYDAPFVDDLAVDPMGRFLYAASSSVRALVFRINPSTGALEPVGTPVASEERTVAVVAHPNGRWIYTAINTASGGAGSSLRGYAVDASTGALSEIGRGPFLTPMPASAYFDEMLMAPDGRHVYTRNNGRRIAIFDVDSISGVPTAATPFDCSAALDRFLLHANGARMYVVQSEASNTALRALDIDSNRAPRLTYIDGPHITGRPYGVAAHPQGGFLYVGDDKPRSIVIYRIDAAGALTFERSIAMDNMPFRLAVAR